MFMDKLSSSPSLEKNETHSPSREYITMSCGKEERKRDVVGEAEKTGEIARVVAQIF